MSQSSTRSTKVFSFYPEDRPCNGLDDVLFRYRELAKHVKLSGPTNFAPLIYKAIDIVRNSDNRFHVLLIIADGQGRWWIKQAGIQRQLNRRVQKRPWMSAVG